jgi:hypothetical protein
MAGQWKRVAALFSGTWYLIPLRWYRAKWQGTVKYITLVRLSDSVRITDQLDLSVLKLNFRLHTTIIKFRPLWECTIYFWLIRMLHEWEWKELDGPRSVRSACDRRSWATFSMVSQRMGDQNLLSRDPPCYGTLSRFGRHVKLLVPVTFAVVSTL